jgi:protein-S-isoprenylcysteine O-methyltransferase Ste14
VGILIYIKLIEEKELEDRFGSEYLEYKRRTPFLIPRLWEKDEERKR